MGKQACIDISSDKQGVSKEIGFCDLNKTLSLFEEFSRFNRAACPTLEELGAEDAGVEPFDHDHLAFDVCFGRKDPGSQEHSNCYLSASALKPSGYVICLTVPRYWMGYIPIPKGMIIPRGCLQYNAKNGAVLARDQVVMIIQALFLRPDKELAGWAQSQTYLKRTY